MICFKNCDNKVKCEYIYITDSKIVSISNGSITDIDDVNCYDTNRFIKYLKSINFVECEFSLELKAQVL
jgi:hypothetical protein